MSKGNSGQSAGIVSLGSVGPDRECQAPHPRNTPKAQRRLRFAPRISTGCRTALTGWMETMRYDMRPNKLRSS